MAITKDSIIKASLDILNRDGINNLSMRALAKELDIKAASLYWHIKDKQDLYDLIAEHINKEIVLPKNLEDPKETLIALSLEIRRVLLNTRDAVEVLATSFPRTPSRIEGIKFILATLTSYGVSNKNCLTAANILNNYVLSFVADEIRGKDISPDAAKQFGLIFGEQYEMSIDFEGQFLYGLEVILAGLLVD
ncbi:TetR/AcrR family transcriptional regulator C-terminal domain-containing protein [Clostridium paridis]|uniref:TetR/AcrR family transcriptional regulator C-terminal domain-containing protein n=1 Tax=Clostridium paridis TaxID=2803863 RepID=A0A937FH21_9CLOT|nr:TetR/AcrR family transcriptional regulator C-terminal domain-containing protein [Clostridium paridis]MBL4933244.1 TetR/AcrR family transcriptional regulator C-terminal domain-containing protein [Clostridium paridis]